MKENNQRPSCFGNLEIVFPMTEEGLRQTPDSCMECIHKTQCLRSAMSQGNKAIEAQEEYVDRAYESGMIGFLSRWSKKKQLDKMRKK